MSTDIGRRVVTAANRNRATGEIALGVRHFCPLMRKQIKAFGGGKDWVQAEQGFVDNKGVFMTREEAFELATETGQIIRLCGDEEQMRLSSENLH